jgi:hypothetical protein
MNDGKTGTFGRIAFLSSSGMTKKSGKFERKLFNIIYLSVFQMYLQSSTSRELVSLIMTEFPFGYFEASPDKGDLGAMKNRN